MIQAPSHVNFIEQLSETDVFHVAPSLWYAESQDGAVLVDFDHNVRVLINQIGVRIFKRLNESESVGTITEAFVSEFAMSKKQPYGDVSEFIGATSCDDRVGCAHPFWRHFDIFIGKHS